MGAGQRLGILCCNPGGPARRVVAWAIVAAVTVVGSGWIVIMVPRDSGWLGRKGREESAPSFGGGVTEDGAAISWRGTRRAGRAGCRGHTGPTESELSDTQVPTLGRQEDLHVWRLGEKLGLGTATGTRLHIDGIASHEMRGTTRWLSSTHIPRLSRD